MATGQGEIVVVTGPSGVPWRHRLPLPPGVARRVEAGELRVTREAQEPAQGDSAPRQAPRARNTAAKRGKAAQRSPRAPK